jgi:phosphinothricin acetyltransferase
MHSPSAADRPVITCTAAHLPAIQAIYNHAILHSTSLYEYHERTTAVMEEWFAVRTRDRTPILGIEWEPGVLAGFATWGPFRLRPAYKYTVEHSVYVDERFRGRGIGRRATVLWQRHLAVERDREDASVFGLVGVVESLGRSGVRVEHVVGDDVHVDVAVGTGLGPRLERHAARRHVASVVALHCECPWLVESDPKCDAMGVPRPDEISVPYELVDDTLVVRRVPAALVLVKRRWQVPMVQRHIGLDACGGKCIKQLIVKLQAKLIWLHLGGGGIPAHHAAPRD